jgi:hypothetical protein
VFIDEISRCRPEVQNKLLSLIHQRRVQGLPLRNLVYRLNPWRELDWPCLGVGDDDRHRTETGKEASSLFAYVPTPEPFLGHLGVPASARRDGWCRTNSRSAEHRIRDQLANKRSSGGSSGPCRRQHISLRLQPVYRHSAEVHLSVLSAAFANLIGFVTASPQLASTKFPNIYAAGVAVAVSWRRSATICRLWISDGERRSDELIYSSSTSLNAS